MLENQSTDLHNWSLLGVLFRFHQVENIPALAPFAQYTSEVNTATPLEVLTSTFLIGLGEIIIIITIVIICIVADLKCFSCLLQPSLSSPFCTCVLLLVCSSMNRNHVGQRLHEWSRHHGTRLVLPEIYSGDVFVFVMW